MLDDEKSREFRKNNHKVKPYVNGHLDMSGPNVSGIRTGEHQERIMKPVLEDPLFKHLNENAYKSEMFPSTEPKSEK